MERSFESLVRRARLLLLLERVWPLMLGACLIAGAFLTVSFAGFWLIVPGLVRAIGLFLFALALAFVLFELVRVKLPTRTEALQRIDVDSALPHRVAAAFDDKPVSGAEASIWAEHRRRLALALRNLRLRKPRSSMVRRDPYALRAGVLVMLVASAFVAGNEKEMRVRTAFDVGAGPQALAAARLDGWIVPPNYTHRAPILFLGEKIETRSTSFSVPIDSQVHLRGAALGGMALQTSGGLKALPGSDAGRNFVLAGDAQLGLDGTRQFTFQAIPDLPPTIILNGDPESPGSGHLLLHYKTNDDYGVVSAQARFSAGRDIADRHPLVPPPLMDLLLPAGNGIGDAETTLDLADHPWAGAKVRLVLVAKDEGGHEGLSAPVELVLPERIFRNPLARALMEQRRHLVMEPDMRREEVRLALDGLLIAPDLFSISASTYLGMQTAALRLRRAKDDADLLDVAQILHDMALDLEDRSHTAAEQQLKAAQQALRDAIKNGASPEEIAKLMQNLRDALANVVREAGQKPRTSSSPNQSVTEISPEDLKNLMDRIEEMAKSGNTAELQALLDQLDEITSNLQADDGTAKQSPLDQTLNALDSLMQDQQGLRDKTYQQQGAGPKDQAGREALQQEQSQLRRKLENLGKALKDSGLEGDPALDAAGEAMKQAESALGNQDNNSANAAVEAQGRALEDLRRGAQNLAQKGEKNAGKGQNGRDGQSSSRDPLGRGSNNGNSKFDRGYRSGPLNADAARRIQEIFREIQRRAGEAQRPASEREYLDRLLRNF